MAINAIRPLGIDHLVLRVIDLPRTVTWYVEVLGCRVERVLPDFGLTQLRAGSTLIDLVDVARPAGAAGGQLGVSGGRNLDHFCLRVEPFEPEAIRAHLQAHGVVCGAVERRYGAEGHGPSIYLHDPEGNQVELKGPPDPDQAEQVSEALPGAT